MNEGQLIREVPGYRRVYRTVLAGEPCVTRVLLTARVSPTLGPLVEKIVLHGHGSMLGIIPEELQLTLEGYRVAARLPLDVGPPLPWTRAVAATVTSEGHVAISTRWIEGIPLHDLPPVAPDEARGRALDALRILVALHARLVSYGDFKSENLVLRPDGTIALIDLDTLREVAEPTAWAPTRDLTRSWAAPEQVQAQRTYLASDLWAWARLVRHLFPGGPPDGWGPALAACAAPEPLARPRTDVLLSHLELGTPLTDWMDRPAERTGPHPGTVGRAATERVPEAPRSIATERVPETGAPHATERVPEGVARPLPTPVLATPEPPRRARPVLYMVIALVSAPILLCTGAGLWWERHRVAQADAAAEETVGALKAYKTQHAINKDRSRRIELRTMADDAVDIRETPRSLAVQALATVWALGWQDAGRQWDPDEWERAQALVSRPEARKEPELLLALGTQEAAACRLDPLATAATVHCKRALDAIAELQERIGPSDEENWLRVEGAWTEVLVRSQLVAQARRAGLPEATAELDAARASCTRAEAWFAYAPVNGPELFQDCLHLAGVAGEWDDYLRWGALLIDADRADGDVSEETFEHLYSAGDGCQDTRVDLKRGRWVIKGTAWCVALGHSARGCRDLAQEAHIEGRVYEPDHPWDDLARALAAAPVRACAD